MACCDALVLHGTTRLSHAAALSSLTHSTVLGAAPCSVQPGEGIAVLAPPRLTQGTPVLKDPLSYLAYSYNADALEKGAA